MHCISSTEYDASEYQTQCRQNHTSYFATRSINHVTKVRRAAPLCGGERRLRKRFFRLLGLFFTPSRPQGENGRFWSVSEHSGYADGLLRFGEIFLSGLCGGSGTIRPCNSGRLPRVTEGCLMRRHTERGKFLAIRNFHCPAARGAREVEKNRRSRPQRMDVNLTRYQQDMSYNLSMKTPFR